MRKYIKICNDNFINQMKYHKYFILKEIIICKLIIISTFFLLLYKSSNNNNELSFKNRIEFKSP